MTFNHRVGAEGYGHFEGAVPNRALLDQVAALEWVRDNIAAFGGDPGRVTVSASPRGRERGRAARDAGRPAVPPGRGAERRRPPLPAARLGRPDHGQARRKLGIEATAEEFAAVPLDALLPAQAGLRGEIGARPDPALWGEAALNMMPFEPVLDELPLPDADCGVELLTGSNREEYRLFLVPTERLHVLPRTKLRTATAVRTASIRT